MVAMPNSFWQEMSVEQGIPRVGAPLDELKSEENGLESDCFVSDCEEATAMAFFKFRKNSLLGSDEGKYDAGKGLACGVFSASFATSAFDTIDGVENRELGFDDSSFVPSFLLSSDVFVVFDGISSLSKKDNFSLPFFCSFE